MLMSWPSACFSCWMDILGIYKGRWEDRTVCKVWIGEAASTHGTRAGTVKDRPKSAEGSSVCPLSHRECSKDQWISR